MNHRNQEILENLEKFYVLDRDQLIQLHFQEQKQSITTCNRIVNRLTSKGLVKVDRTTRPYNYFHNETNMKLNSTKIPHFKAITQTYLDLYQFTKPSIFEVEMKLGAKGTIEPDIYVVWNSAPMFIELQKNRYTLKVMQAKIDRYQAYYDSKEWKMFTEQFPFILILSETRYNIDTGNLGVYQAKDIQDFIKSYF
ncbi:replication-relaxation family protein [Priestia megaterium]|uniref:replication-relaxation family protein n=1 Tax=Priestia megaterium TaxID=1404 RepID=UPI0035D573CC